jgi:DNA helicase HerA-like ATPase
VGRRAGPRAHRADACPAAGRPECGSQRPSDISPTIISQLHNYFLHRLINNEDIRAVEKTISYLDKVSFEYLPILPTGTCIFAGLLANVPVVVDIQKMDDKFEPRSKTRTLIDQWQ